MAFVDLINEIKNNTTHISSINGHDVDLYYNEESNDLYQIDDNWIRKIRSFGEGKNPFYSLTIGRLNGKQLKGDISFPQPTLSS